MPDESRYEAVIFDLFGTLITTVAPTRYQSMIRDVSGALGCDYDSFHDHWRATVDLRESGQMGNVQGILESMASHAGLLPPNRSVRDAAEKWVSYARNWLDPRPGAIETLATIASKGIKVGLLSNCSDEVVQVWAETPFPWYFTDATFSCEVRVMKPDPEIYHGACRRLEVLPKNCLFVGDGGARELTGALAVGMDALLIRVPGEEHTWFDQNYRLDALEWQGPVITSIAQVLDVLAPT